MYNILGKLFDYDRREQFIRKVINMIDGRKIFEDWEIEQLNELVKYTSEKNIREDALKEGRAEGLKEGIKNMLKENMDIELISRISNKTKDEILEIKKKTIYISINRLLYLS